MEVLKGRTHSESLRLTLGLDTAWQDQSPVPQKQAFLHCLHHHCSEVSEEQAIGLGSWLSWRELGKQ